MDEHATYDMMDVRVEQATLLKTRVLASCVYVAFLICNYAIILAVSGFGFNVAVWFSLAMAMVFVTYFYAKLKAPDGITRNNVNSYLKGHVLISCCSGAIWGGYAAYILDWDSELSILISTFLVCGITIGGMLPSSAYRPGYLGLATFALMPPAACILFAAQWPLNLVGLAILVYFVFGVITSKRGEQDLHESIFARNERERTAQIEAENTIIRRVNEEKTRFLSATSHDLSQPLHAQGYFIQALKEKISDTDQKSLLEKIELTWRRQSQFLKGLVDINRLESGAITPKPVNVDLAKEMEALLDEFSEIAREKFISLNKDLEPCTCVTDPVLLNRVVRNVLSNSIKYTPDDGSVEVELKRHATTAEIVIRDTGTGIADSQQERVFEEYVQLVDQSENLEGGVGLGLSIVRKLAKLLDIDIELSSELGKGTTVSLILPNSAIEEPGLNPENIQAADKEHSFAWCPLILLVDDEPAIREAMSNLLTEWGCKLISAANSKEAINLLNHTTDVPALLIVDKWLPDGENGLDLIERLREEVNEDTPALLMSGDPEGLADRDDIARVSFLSKPVEPASIRKLLDEVTAEYVAH